MIGFPSSKIIEMALRESAGFSAVFLKLAALGVIVRLLLMGVRTRFAVLVCVDTLDNPQLLQLLCLVVHTLRGNTAHCYRCQGF